MTKDDEAFRFWHKNPGRHGFNKTVRKHRWSAEILADLNAKAIGELGEKVAAKWAQSSGFQIIARGIRHIGFELDLVIRKDFDMRIIEVKTRLDPRAEPGGDATEAWLNRKKKNALVKGAEFILQKLGPDSITIRSISFDLLVVDITKSNGQLSVYRWPDVLA